MCALPEQRTTSATLIHSAFSIHLVGHPGATWGFFHFFPLSLLCCHWFLFSHCKILCKCWALHCNSCEQGEMLLSTCQGAVLHRITENSVGKSSSALISRMGSAPLNLVFCLARYWRVVEPARPLHSTHPTAPPFLSWKIIFLTSSLFHVEPVLLVILTLFFHL